MSISARHRIACLVVAAALAAPPAAWAQGAGDEQYQDPFAGSGGQSGGQTDDHSGDRTGDSSSGAQGPDTPVSSDTATTAQTAPTTTASTAQPAPGGAEQLPRTGGDAGLPALAGAVLLAGGVALRVRLRKG